MNTTTTTKQNKVLLRGCEQGASNLGEAWQHFCKKMVKTIKHDLSLFLSNLNQFSIFMYYAENAHHSGMFS